MQGSQSVIAVGNELGTGLPKLLLSLKEHGFDLIQAGNAEDLLTLLGRNQSVIIVAFESRGKDTARRVLQTVAEAQRKIPVVVVTSEGSFEEYYELMSEGAYDYFDPREGPEVIERSVRWAAGARAA